MLDDLCADDGVANPDRIGTRRDFARELSLVKERASLTVRDVARALGIPASTAGGYFAGRYLPVQPAGMLRKVLVACGVTDEADIQRWLAALGRVRRAPGPRPADAPAPYRGLESFQPEDAGWFFGRHELTELLVEQPRLRGEQGGDTTRLWLATPAAAARYVCSISGVTITRAEWEQYLPELPYNPPCKT